MEAGLLLWQFPKSYPLIQILPHTPLRLLHWERWFRTERDHVCGVGYLKTQCRLIFQSAVRGITDTGDEKTPRDTRLHSPERVKAKQGPTRISGVRSVYGQWNVQALAT